MLIIRGTNVFPSQVEDVLAGIEGVSAPLPHRRGQRGGLDRMTVHVELKPEAFSDSYEEMDAFRTRHRREAEGRAAGGRAGEAVEPGGIERTTGKAKHVEDLRKK